MTLLQGHTETDLAALRARLRAAALRQLRANVRSGYDPYYRRRFVYVRPSPGRYKWMWFWDACFHIAALTRVDPELARAELDTLLASQDPDGFIGHLVYWGRMGAFWSAVFSQSRPCAWRARHSHMIQPPLLAQAVERLYAAEREDGRSELLESVLPKVAAYYDWLDRVRLDPRAGLIAIVSPFEAGVDNSPAYDLPMGFASPGRTAWLVKLRLLDMRNTLLGGRPGLPAIPARPAFLLYDLLVNYAYADGLRALARLHDAARDAPAAERARERARAVESAVNERCWDADRGLYFHVDALTGRQIKVSTASSLLPALFPTAPADRRAAVVERHLRNPMEYWLDFPVPSVARSEPTFDPVGESMIWRGPAAINLNWLVVRGLRQAGLAAEAGRIAERSAVMAARSGFREFYNPLTGGGLRGKRFGWATTAVDMES